jgi:hypothetical protein
LHSCLIMNWGRIKFYIYWRKFYFALFGETRIFSIEYKHMMDAYQQRLKMINLHWKLINNWHFFGFSLVSSQFHLPRFPIYTSNLNIMYLRTHREAWLIFLFYYTFYFFLRRYIKYWKWTHRGRFIDSEMRWYSSIFSSVHHSLARSTTSN